MSSSRAMQRLCGLMRKAVQDYEMIVPGDKVMAVSYTHLTLPTSDLV